MPTFLTHTVLTNLNFPCCSYYVRSQDCSLAQFYVPQVLDTLIQEIKDADAVISKFAPDLPRWLGETSSASGGGALGISDRFVAGFMWVSKLLILMLFISHNFQIVDTVYPRTSHPLFKMNKLYWMSWVMTPSRLNMGSVLPSFNTPRTISNIFHWH